MTQAGHVHGQVLRPDGHAAADAVVTLLDPRGTQVGYSETTANGTYGVPIPAPGRYLMVVAAPGHDPWVRRITATDTALELPVVLPAPQSATPVSPQAFPPATPEAPATAFPGDRPPPPTASPAQPSQGAPTAPPSQPFPGEQAFPPAATGSPARPFPGEQPFASPGQPGQGFPAEPGYQAPWPVRDDMPQAYPAEPAGWAAPPANSWPEQPATHVASAPAAGFGQQVPVSDHRRDETTALAAQAALSAIAEGRQLPASSLYGLVTALLASRVDLETDPSSALARTAARIGGTRGDDLDEGRRAADAILAPLARQLLTEEPGSARHERRHDAADPENVIALLRPLIEALAADMETRTTR